MHGKQHEALMFERYVACGMQVGQAGFALESETQRFEAWVFCLRLLSILGDETVLLHVM